MTHETPEHLAGAETLLEAHELITGPRQAAYDHPYDDYSKVVEIFAGLTGVELSLSEALLFMVSVKFARLRTSIERDGLHHDSLVDAMGYLGCLAMVKNRHELEIERERLEADAAEVGLDPDEWAAMKETYKQEKEAFRG